MHISTYIYACIYHLSRLIRESWLSYAWLTHACVQWPTTIWLTSWLGLPPLTKAQGFHYLFHIYIYIYVYYSEQQEDLRIVAFLIGFLQPFTRLSTGTEPPFAPFSPLEQHIFPLMLSRSTFVLQ
jgi:hypothetical protein